MLGVLDHAIKIQDQGGMAAVKCRTRIQAVNREIIRDAALEVAHHLIFAIWATTRHYADLEAALSVSIYSAALGA